MSEIRVTFSALSTAQADIGTTVTHIGGQLDDLRRYLAPMVATWQGEAAAFYLEQQRAWDTSAAELATVLRQIGVALGAANDGYREVETLNARRWPGAG